jgi:hypothetical protein
MTPRGAVSVARQIGHHRRRTVGERPGRRQQVATGDREAVHVHQRHRARNLRTHPDEDRTPMDLDPKLPPTRLGHDAIVLHTPMVRPLRLKTRGGASPIMPRTPRLTVARRGSDGGRVPRVTTPPGRRRRPRPKDNPKRQVTPEAPPPHLIRPARTGSPVRPGILAQACPSLTVPRAVAPTGTNAMADLEPAVHRFRAHPVPARGGPPDAGSAHPAGVCASSSAKTSRSFASCSCDRLDEAR